MRNFILMTLSSLSLVWACAEEKNPYKDGMRKGTTQSSSGSSETASGAKGNAEAQSGGTAAGTATSPAMGQAAVTTESTKEVAKTSSIPPASLSGSQLVCQSQTALAKFPTEFAVLCVNGQPSSAFASLLSTPYKGTGLATVAKIKSEDVNSISTFILATSFEIPLPLATTVGKRGKLGVANFVEGNATMDQMRVADIAPEGANGLGGFESKETLVVKVAIVTVTDVRIMESKYLTLKPDLAVAGLISLKPGAPDNAENTVANIITFMIADGNTTKFVAVTHQQIANRGQGPAAETTALAVARRMAEEGFKALAN
ncbi:MAG: hypothetical protein NTX25_11570 [Proteobacteria bacterium]|nr:hypothetical protein [Pseudomonadota bacterium]